MAKKPGQRFDEEAILRLRDGVSNSEQLLDATALRALADARLQALAFALESRKDLTAGGDTIDDTRFVAYLLDLLSPTQRYELEQALIGDRQEFSRLATLRLAFDRPTDKRDRKHANLAERKTPRHHAAQIDIRQFGDRLKFRDASELPRPAARAARLPPPPLAALRDAPEPWRPKEFSAGSAFLRSERVGRPWPTWEPKTGTMVNSALGRVSQALLSAAALLDSARRSLAMREKLELGRHSRLSDEASSSEDAQSWDLDFELADLLQKIHEVVSEIPPTVAEAINMMPPPRETVSKMADDSLVAFAVDAFSEAVTPVETEKWADNWTVEVGPWMLDLTGSTRPRPEMTVAVRNWSRISAETQPFLTLIHGQSDFDYADLDAEGNARFEIPTGNNKLLVQGSEIWEIGLRLR